MAAQLVERELFLETKSLCEACGNAVPQMCAFMRGKDPEASLAFVGAEAVKMKVKLSSNKEGEIYKITSCHKHKPGNLPGMAEVTHESPEPDNESKKYDLSCPLCGSLEKISVAGMREHPKNPREWFCRCRACNKGFRPRKKEANKNMGPVNEVNKNANENANLRNDNEDLRNDSLDSQPNGAGSAPEPEKTRLEIARDKLPKEVYQEYKNKGLKDTTIMEQFSIANDIFYKLKSEWGLIGQLKKSAAELKPEKETPPTGTRLTISQAIELHDDLEEDRDGLDFLLEVTKNTAFSPRVKKLLTWYRDEYQHSLEHIKKAFESTEISI